MRKPATITPAVLPGCVSAVGRAAHTSQKGITCGGRGGAFTAHHPNKFHLGTPGSIRPQGKWQNCSKAWSLFPQTTAGPSGKEGPREPLRMVRQLGPHRACPVFPPSLCGMPHPSSPSDRKPPGTWGAGAGCLEAMGHSIQLPKANRPKSLSLLSLVSSAATTWTFKPQGWVACPRLLPTAHMFRSPSPSAPSESQEPECVTSQPCCGQPQAQLP